MVKAARALGLPTLMLVWSWDNLSSKAVLHEHPDRLLVWNETAGARGGRRSTASRPSAIEVRRRAELRPLLRGGRGGRRPNAAATRSSTSARRRTSPRTSRRSSTAGSRPCGRVPTRASATPRCVVRPHPAGEAWLDWTPPDERVSLERPAREDRARHARRAARAGRRRRRPEHERRDRGGDRRPARADVPRRSGRARTGGLDPLPLPARAEGGFVLDAATLDEHVAQLAQVLAGDYDPAPTERFVERFVRPRGLDEPVAPIVAAAALELAGARSPPRWAAPREAARQLVALVARRARSPGSSASCSTAVSSWSSPASRARIRCRRRHAAARDVSVVELPFDPPRAPMHHDARALPRAQRPRPLLPARARRRRLAAPTDGAAAARLRRPSRTADEAADGSQRWSCRPTCSPQSGGVLTRDRAARPAEPAACSTTVEALGRRRRRCWSPAAASAAPSATCSRSTARARRCPR